MYRSLIPLYLPPYSSNVDHIERASTSVEPSSPPPRTLFGTIGEAIRKISSGKLPAHPRKRQLEPSEEDVLIAFETHAQGCTICSQIPQIYAAGKDLCDDGYRLAAQVLRYLYMKSDQSVHSLRSEEAAQAEVEIPEDLFQLSLDLLKTVEKSFRDPDRDRPFVSNQPALGKLRRPEFTVYKLQVTVTSRHDRERVFSRIHIWSDPSSGWESFQASEPTLHLTRGSLVIREGGNESVSESVTRFTLNPQSIFNRTSPTEIFVDHANAEQLLDESNFALGFQSQTDCEMVLTRLKHAAVNSPSATGRLEMEKGIAQVFSWSHSLEQWESLDSQDAEATLHITPGNLQIFQSTSNLKSWLEIELSPRSTVMKLPDTEILIESPSVDGGSGEERAKKIMLRCQSSRDCDILLARLKRAADEEKPDSHNEGGQAEEGLPKTSGSEDIPPGVTIYHADVTVPSRDFSEEAFAQVSVWGNSAQKWALFTSSDSAASLNVTPGYLEIAANGSETSNSVRMRLKLTPLSVIRRNSSVEILMDSILTEGVSVALTPYIGRYLLKSSSKMDCDTLQSMLERAIKSSPHEAVIDENPSLNDSSNSYNFNKRPEALEEQSKADEELSRKPGVSGQSGVGTSDTRLQTDSSFPGFLEHRILTHIESLPQNRNKTVDELELATELNESRANITEAVEHLRSLRLVAAIPERNHTWVSTEPNAPIPSDTRQSLFAELAELSEGSDSEPNLSPLLPLSFELEDTSSFIPTENLDEGDKPPEAEVQLQTSASGGSSENLHRTPSASETAPSFTSLSNPMYIRSEELNVEEYFEHADAPSSSGTPDRGNVPKDYAKPYTKVDKRLVYRSVLEKAELEFWEKEQWFHVFKVIGKEEMLQLHRDTRRLWERGLGITSHLSLKRTF